ncbi:hypothetical protein D3C87_1666180 [compost metagenome]
MSDSFLGAGVGASVRLADGCDSVEAAAEEAVGSEAFLSGLQPVSAVKAMIRPITIFFFNSYFPLVL